jgi:hypothetical protein
MKRIHSILFVIVSMVILSVTPSCQDETFVTFTGNSPVYLSYDDLRSAVKVTTQKPLEVPGKIYFKGNYIFINEQRKGIHVYDNTNPANPVYKTFIEIPGNVDIAIRNNFLYADSYVDLVVLDIADITQPKEVHRISNAFDYTLPEYDTKYELGEVDREKGVVVRWEVKEIRQRINYSPIFYPVFYRETTWNDALSGYSGSQGGGVTGGGETFGVGGSMARFGQYGNYLFTLASQYQLKTYKAETDGKLSIADSTYVSWGIETLFILNETMFIGGNSGMYIYSLSNMPKVNYISQFNHFRACDPVVADEKYAYVTLKVGGPCGRGQNLLEVIDISNLKSPVLKNSYQMTSPMGLGKDDDILFVCDGDAGLRILDASKPAQQMPQLANYNTIHAYDVIPLQGHLFLIGNDGFYQYDYSNIADVKLLSHIAVTPAP